MTHRRDVGLVRGVSGVGGVGGCIDRAACGEDSSERTADGAGER